MRSSRDWQMWLAHLAIFGRTIGAALDDLDAGRQVDGDELTSALAIAAGDWAKADGLLRQVAA